LETKVEKMRGRRGLNVLFYLRVLGSSRSPDGAVVNILGLPIEFFTVACSFVRFHTFIIVNNYIDISRKMNYNRNLLVYVYKLVYLL